MTMQETVRTVSQPMAFTGAEFFRGVLAAWISFMILLVGTLVATGIQQSGLPWGPPLSMIAMYLMFGIPIGGIVSAIVTLAAAPAAWAIGRWLSRTPHLGVHIAVYAVFGMLLGWAVLAVGVLTTGGDFTSMMSSPLSWLTAAICALAVVIGWGWTVWRIGHRPREDLDALAEDAC